MKPVKPIKPKKFFVPRHEVKSKHEQEWLNCFTFYVTLISILIIGMLIYVIMTV